MSHRLIQSCSKVNHAVWRPLLSFCLIILVSLNVLIVLFYHNTFWILCSPAGNPSFNCCDFFKHLLWQFVFPSFPLFLSYNPLHHVVLLSCHISAGSVLWDTQVMEREINLTWNSMRNTQPFLRNDSSYPRARLLSPKSPRGAHHCEITVVWAALRRWRDRGSGWCRDKTSQAWSITEL